MEHSCAATVFFPTARGAVCPSLAATAIRPACVGSSPLVLDGGGFQLQKPSPALCSPLLPVCVCVRRRRRSGAQWVGVGLLQAERAVVRERVVVVVFDQSWQGGEGHFTVQENVVLLPRWMAHVTVASFAWFEHTDNWTLFIHSQNSTESSRFLTSWNNL